jgi:hypothetical protein
VCTCGVGAIPVVDGQVHHFGARGLYNGGLLTGDRETGSYWQHLTGVCLHGPLAGKRLEVYPLLHLTAAQAADAYPDAELAFSRLSLAQQIIARGQGTTIRALNGRLPPGFQLTMGEVDARLPMMEPGLAAWGDGWARFYPEAAIQARGNALIDCDHRPQAGENPSCRRRTVVSIDPPSGIPFGLYTDATACNWQEGTLVLDTGETLRGPILYDAQGRPQAAERPKQSVTCWYTFAFTFPGGEISGL